MPKLTSEELESAVQKLFEENEHAGLFIIVKEDKNLRYGWRRCEIGAAIDMTTLVRKAMVEQLSK